MIGGHMPAEGVKPSVHLIGREGTFCLVAIPNDLQRFHRQRPTSQTHPVLTKYHDRTPISFGIHVRKSEESGRLLEG
jgi:hypothetical protein